MKPQTPREKAKYLAQKIADFIEDNQIDLSQTPLEIVVQEYFRFSAKNLTQIEDNLITRLQKEGVESVILENCRMTLK
ncbi:MAG: hypothetical protein QNJ54_35005 [Prochloraceae cyanobacterium]|nr:hypothetical protein [Prochloraceae cyanobacterium]